MKYTIFLLIFLVFISSCVSYNKMLYINEGEEVKIDTLYTPEDSEYRLKTGDILYIRVHTGNEEIDNMFSLWGGGSRSMNQSTGLGINMYYYGYSVDDLGQIDVPVVGYLDVLGLTIREAKEKIQQKVDEYLESALVVVKLNSIRFTLLGEIPKPGVLQANVHKLTIFDALAMGGDIQIDGNKYNTTILRRSEKGIERLKLDLTDINILTHKGYYIQNDDVIYIEPRRFVAFRSNTRDFLLVVGSVSSALASIIVLISLNSIKN